MNPESLICAYVKELEIYEPPDWEKAASRAGVPPERLIRLDANENPYAQSPRARAALARFRDYSFYPDYRELERAVAHYAQVSPENVVLGNGGDEVIDLVVRTFVAPGEGAIICSPAFSMYRVSTRAYRGQVLEVPRRKDFSLDLRGIEALVGNAEASVRPKLLFVTSPGNPDGQAISLETIRRLLRLPLAVVVDEAYVEFGGASAVPLLETNPNLIVLRTLSKWAGMAGLRLGYAVTSPSIASAMARLKPPYNINAVAMVVALATFQDMAWVQAQIDRVINERERLTLALESIEGIDPIRSQANFVLCRLDNRPGREIADALATAGILVRSFSATSLADTIRITVGRPEQNDAVVTAIEAVLCNTGNVELTLPAARPAGRRGYAQRQTRETDVRLSLDLDGVGEYEVDTGLGFLDHMLAQIAAHGLFDLVARAQGDLHVDEHHTVEDVAIGLGQAVDEALGDRRGIARMGQAYAPLDEALARVVVDLSGRPYAVVEAEFAGQRVGAVDTSLIIHFLETLAVNARMSLHARVLYGRNDHHKAEALFKALGRALDAATRLDPRRSGVPSTKGSL
jgi:histidinol-phosphate aminotransferase